MLVIVLSVLTCGQVRALDNDEIIEMQAQALGLEDLQKAAQEYAPNINWSQTPDFNQGLSSLLEMGTQSVGGIVMRALRSGVILLTIVLFSGVAESVAVTGAGKGASVIQISASLAVTAVAVSDANALIGLGSELIEKMDVFSKVLLPTMAAVTAVSGLPGTAAAKQMATMLFSDVLMSLINRFLLPLVYAYIAASTAHAALGNDGLKRVAAALKWVVTSVLAAVLIAFVGYLSVSGTIAGTTDAITLKATKFTVSSVVPVVGGILSDAAETVLAGAGILKNAVGVFGMLVVLGMCVVPFLQLGIHYLTYKLAAALSAAVADSNVVRLIDKLSSAFGLVLGMAGACALLLLVSMVSAVKVVVP